MLDRVQKTRLRHAFSFPLSAIGHHPPAPGLGERSPLFHSLWSCAGMQTLKKGSPPPQTTQTSKQKGFFSFPAPKPGVALKIDLGSVLLETALGVRWPRPGGLQGALLRHHH